MRAFLALPAVAAAVAWVSAGALQQRAAPAVPVPAVAAAEQQGRFEVVGRGPVTRTRTTDLWVFTGVDGRDYAYTGTFGRCPGCVGNRLFVWDVTDPARPVLTDSVVVDSRVVNDVVVNRQGTLAVITRQQAESRRNGIVVLDLADPAHPRPVADYWETLLGGSQNLFIDGSTLYVVDLGTQSLAIFDLSNPSDPAPLGRFTLPGGTAADVRYLNDVFVKDGLAYLSYWDDGLVIVDVGNGIKEGTPRRPRMVSQFRYRTEWRGERYGNTHTAFAYTNRDGRPYVFVGDLIFPETVDYSRKVQTGGYIHVLDVRNPQVPLEVATYEVEGTGINNFWVEDDVLYVGAFSGGLRAVDVSGELRGSLRGREIAALPTTDAQAVVPDLPMTWGAMPHKGLVFATDLNSGLWVTRLVRGAPAQ